MKNLLYFKTAYMQQTKIACADSVSEKVIQKVMRMFYDNEETRDEISNVCSVNGTNIEAVSIWYLDMPHNPYCNCKSCNRYRKYRGLAEDARID